MADKDEKYEVTLIRGKTDYVKGVRFERDVPAVVGADVARIASAEVDNVSIKDGDETKTEERKRFRVKKVKAGAAAEEEELEEQDGDDDEGEEKEGEMKSGFEHATTAPRTRRTAAAPRTPPKGKG